MKEWLRQEASLRKVSEMAKRVKALEKRTAETAGNEVIIREWSSVRLLYC